MYRWFVAYKHISSRLITFAALLGVTLSVAVLIVVVSVMEGFRSEMEKGIRGTISDIKIESTLTRGLRERKNHLS
jgi:ABC-type lipoprotein release transport system permease subunit